MTIGDLIAQLEDAISTNMEKKKQKNKQEMSRLCFYINKADHLKLKKLALKYDTNVSDLLRKTVKELR